MDPKILGVGQRTSAYLKEYYPKNRAKLIARDFNVSVGTAERWLSGQAPTVAHIEQMAAVFGEGYIRCVFSEAFNHRDERIRSLEDQLVSAAQGLLSGALIARDFTLSMNALPNTRLRFKMARIMTWASHALRFVNIPEFIRLIPDKKRQALIEELIETIPTIEHDPTIKSQGEIRKLTY